MAAIFFSRIGYELQKAKMLSLESEIKDLQSKTHDISESEGNILEDNPAYESIQQSTSVLTARRRKLKDELDNAQIITYPKSVDEVCIGCTIEIKLDGKQGKYDIVGYGEAGSYKNAISYSSPVAVALMGKKAGYECNIPINKEYRNIELLKVCALEKNE
ncbi:MAG: GreA/GreB family elongation factor [Candidatus Woesearchaeota archaeon]